MLFHRSTDIKPSRRHCARHRERKPCDVCVGSVSSTDGMMGNQVSLYKCETLVRMRRSPDSNGLGDENFATRVADELPLAGGPTTGRCQKIEDMISDHRASRDLHLLPPKRVGRGTELRFERARDGHGHTFRGGAVNQADLQIELAHGRISNRDAATNQRGIQVLTDHSHATEVTVEPPEIRRTRANDAETAIDASARLVLTAHSVRARHEPNPFSESNCSAPLRLAFGRRVAGRNGRSVRDRPS